MMLEELRSRFDGAVWAPDDEGFDAAAHGHSGPSRPDAVLRPATTADVALATVYARETGVPLVPRSGGHSVWYVEPGALLLDLAAFDRVTVDGDLVSVGGGATWGAVARALAPHGLAISSGDTATVGVGGNTLGGGIGWMVRDWGLAVDQLVGAEVVTGAGNVVEAADEPDLLWALRGGGGNVGVVTRFDFRAHRIPGVVFGQIALTGDLAESLRAWRDIMRSAPRQLSVTFMHVPGGDPSAPAGRSLGVCWAGADTADARAAIAPLLAIPGAEAGPLEQQQYAQILLDMPPADPGDAVVLDGNGFVASLDDAAIDDIVAAHESTEPAMLMVRYLGGAFSDVAPDDTAVAFRDAEAFVVRATFLAPGADPTPVREAWAAFDANALGMYGNFTNSTDASVAGRMYPPATADRLRAAKRRFDPDNVLRRNHNVVP